MNRRIRKKQLKKMGKYIPIRDVYNLNMTIVKFILPRLELFRKVTDSYPIEMKSLNEWDDVLDKMITAFRLIYESYTRVKNPEEIKKDYKIIEEGLDLFRKYFYDLWW